MTFIFAQITKQLGGGVGWLDSLMTVILTMISMSMKKKVVKTLNTYPVLILSEVAFISIKC